MLSSLRGIGDLKYVQMNTATLKLSSNQTGFVKGPAPWAHSLLASRIALADERTFDSLFRAAPSGHAPPLQVIVARLTLTRHMKILLIGLFALVALGGGSYYASQKWPD